jgi:hypothetical protein
MMAPRRLHWWSWRQLPASSELLKFIGTSPSSKSTQAAGITVTNGKQPSAVSTEVDCLATQSQQLGIVVAILLSQKPEASQKMRKTRNSRSILLKKATPLRKPEKS